MRITAVIYSANLFPDGMPADIDIEASGRAFAHQLALMIEAEYPMALVVVVEEQNVRGTPPPPEIILDASERELGEEEVDIAQRIKQIEAELVARSDWVVRKEPAQQAPEPKPPA